MRMLGPDLPERSEPEPADPYRTVNSIRSRRQVVHHETEHVELDLLSTFLQNYELAAAAG
jgi:hypothetical protein